MAIENTFRDVIRSLERLKEAVVLLRVTVVEDKPRGAELSLIDKLADVSDDIRGSIEEAVGAARKALQCVEIVDYATARRELTRCQQQSNHISRRFSVELLCYEQISELTTLMRERKGEWPAWAMIVREAIERCQEPVYGLNQALFVCWQELAEHASQSNISVQATGIGQQYALAAETEEP